MHQLPHDLPSDALALCTATALDIALRRVDLSSNRIDAARVQSDRAARAAGSGLRRHPSLAHIIEESCLHPSPVQCCLKREGALPATDSNSPASIARYS